MNRQIISALVAVALVGMIQANEQVKGTTPANKELLHVREVSKTISFDSTMINGLYADPSFGIVDGCSAQEDIGMKLNRSFRENLSENVDKESIARMSE